MPPETLSGGKPFTPRNVIHWSSGRPCTECASSLAPECSSSLLSEIVGVGVELELTNERQVASLVGVVLGFRVEVGVGPPLPVGTAKPKYPGIECADRWLGGFTYVFSVCKPIAPIAMADRSSDMG